MKENITCAGFGGQGIMVLGKLIAQSAMHSGLNVTWMPSYGAEVRGGTAYCMVIVSDDEISSPVVTKCDTLIAMNTPSFNKYVSKIAPKGIAVVNSSIVEVTSPRQDIEIIKAPMTDIAYSLGNIKIANMVALGAYIKRKKLFPEATAIDSIKEFFASDKNLAEINMEAFKKGLTV